MTGSALLRGDIAQLGAIAVQLAAHMPEWIRRRKTTYAFVDDSTIVQRMSVDLVLPPEDWFVDEPPSSGQRIYLPLGVAEKKTFSGFSLVGRDGNPASLLNTFEDGALAAAGFDALIGGLPTSEAVPGRLQEDLRRMVTAPDATNAAEDMAAARRHGLDDVPILCEGTQYRALLDDMQIGFMMMVPVDYKPDASHLFKLEWSARYAWTRGRLGGRVRTAGASLGLLEKRLDFPSLDIGTAHSTHFEFVAPEDVRILEGRLDTGRSNATPQVAASQPRVDLYAAVADRENPIDSRSDRATASITLAPRIGGPFAAIVVVAWLTLLVLAVVADRVAELDAQTISAVILVLPAVLATYLVRQGEHVVTGKLLAGVRLVGLWVAGLSLAAAVLVGVGDLRTSSVPPLATASCAMVVPSLGPAPNPVPGISAADCRSTTPAVRARPHATRAQDVLEAMAVLAWVPTALITCGALATWRRTRRALAVRDVAQTVG